MAIRFIVLSNWRETLSRRLSQRRRGNKTMAVEDDLRRLSEMQAIYRGWQSFFAQVCATDSPTLTATANKEPCGTPQPLNHSPSQNIVHLRCAKRARQPISKTGLSANESSKAG
jgi:hypothetical protein